ncbi:MAG: ABC transporter substrate-binding protein, partial [Bdellovibrionales bacterium]|nr:ABC transporter substrate-binding protein [Bdellovibrionales bacterium]
MVKQLTRSFIVLLLLSSVVFAESKTEPIALGAIYSLSGWGAIGGVAELRATKLAVEEINGAGGIAGRPIELHVEDNRSDLKETVSAFQKLLSTQQIPVLLGPNWAEFAEVVAPIANRSSVVMLTSSGYTRTLTTGKPYVFTTLTPHHTHTRLLFEHIAHAGHKKIAILHSINTYYESIYQSFLERFKDQNIPISKSLAIESKTTDFRSFLLRLKSDGVDAVLALLQESGEIPAFLRQARELGLSAQIYAADISYDDVLHKDPSLAEGVEFFRYVTTSTPEFQNKYEAKYHAPTLLG